MTSLAEMAPGKYIKVAWKVGLVTSIHIAEGLKEDQGTLYALHWIRCMCAPRLIILTIIVAYDVRLPSLRRCL